MEDLVTNGLEAPRGIALDLCGWEGSVDLGNRAFYSSCLTGPDVFASSDCQCADLSGDARVDLVDFLIFQRLFDGSE